MTVKTNDLPTNNLNINEIEQNTPPNSLELGRGEERKPSQFVLGKDARLLYQSMLEKIVDAAIRLGIPLSLVAGTDSGLYPSTCPHDPNQGDRSLIFLEPKHGCGSPPGCRILFVVAKEPPAYKVTDIC